MNFLNIEEAISTLKKGELVAIPTETVYGLAAFVFDESAVKKIFSLKNRPFFDPLIVHVESFQKINEVARHVPNALQILAEQFWPGPLTFVLPKKPEVSDIVTSGLETVAVRCPKHAIALKIIGQVGPLAAPSANQFKKTSPTTAQHVDAEFKNTKLPIVDGGPCEVGVESTVLGCIENSNSITIELYRPGAVTEQQIRDCLNKTAGLNKTAKEIKFVRKQNAASPGQLEHHYMPSIPVVVVQDEEQFEKQSANIKEKLKVNPLDFVDLKLDKNPVFAARELYSKLRECANSNKGYIRVFAKAIERDGMGEAIWDRISRSATLNYSR